MAEKELGSSPWRTIWVQPRKTIRTIVRTNPRLHFWLLSWIYAFPILLQMAQNMSLGEVYPVIGIGVVAAVCAPFVGWLFLSIFAKLLHWTGRWIGGGANYLSLRAAVSWSNVPNIFNVAFWILLSLVFGSILFTQGFSQMDLAGGQLGFVGLVFLAQLVLAIWTFVILLNTISEVQKFSAWKALLNVLMPFLVVFIASWVLSWIVWSVHTLIKS